MNLLALSGSLRRASFNTRLAEVMAERAPEGAVVEVATCRGIPLYDGDVEDEHGIPEPVEALRQRIQAADGLILVTPEYNGGMPGVFKNALDWLTRPPKEMAPTFKDRPTALAGATPGGLGTTLAQAGSLVMLRQLKVHLHAEHLRVSQAGDVLGDDGEVEHKTAMLIEKWLSGFCEFARKA